MVDKIARLFLTLIGAFRRRKIKGGNLALIVVLCIIRRSDRYIHKKLISIYLSVVGSSLDVRK